MTSNRMGWMLAISGSLVLTLMTAACGTLVSPWAGAPVGAAPQYASPGTVPSIQASCDGGTAASTRAACGFPWLLPR
jgi:hypothetical protein